MAPDDEALDETLPSAAAPPADARPGAGDVVDRYRLVARLGEGGMGVVYRAIDQDLDREVAVKLLRTGGGAARLLEEARAMARLKVSSVVTVHDVGTAGGHDFIAMELIAGDTLAGWLRTARPWRDVVRVFVVAGRGLAAAHDAGVIHRDFKPGNVLLGDDGRVAVGDFGLAVAAGEGEGSIAGTPGYMAPEQLAGRAVDARSDQFSFCVALDQAVKGQPIPSRLRRAIARGRAEDPGARHADMAALLRELEAVLATRRRRAIAAAIAGGAVAVAALIAWAVVRGGAPAAADPCSGDPLAAVWPGARPAISRGLEVEPTTRDAAVAGMDRYASAWRARWREGCAARDRDEPTYHEIAACLLDGREEAAALTAELGRPSSALLRDAVAAVESLPDPRRCVPGRVPALPDDPAARERARAIALELARIRGLTRSRATEAAEAARHAVDDARALGHPPTIAAALHVLGAALLAIPDVSAARTSLTDATLAAEEAGDDETRARALIDLARLELVFSQDFDNARRVARQATAAVERHHDPRLRPMLLRTLAELSARDGDTETAITQLAEAATLFDDAKQVVEATDTRLRQATLMRDGGQREAALEVLQGQLAVLEAQLGAADPLTVDVLIDTARVLSQLGRYDEAHAAVEDAATRRPPAMMASGVHRITGQVRDAAGEPVGGATVLVEPFGHWGDGGYAIQPDEPEVVAEQGVQTVVTDVDGWYEATADDGSYLFVAEEADEGRANPRWVSVTKDVEVNLTLQPWAGLSGKVTGAIAPDTHLHVVPEGSGGFQFEVPINDGAYHARMAAGSYAVQVIRNDDQLRDIHASAQITLAPAEAHTLDLVAPARHALTVHVRGEHDVVVDSGAIFAIGGRVDPLPTRGDHLLATFEQAMGLAFATGTNPEPGGCAATLEVPAGVYTLCAIGVQGDLRDPDVRERARDRAAAYTGSCEILDVSAAVERTITVPPPPALPP